MNTILTFVSLLLTGGVGALVALAVEHRTSLLVAAAIAFLLGSAWLLRWFVTAVLGRSVGRHAGTRKKWIKGAGAVAAEAVHEVTT